MNKKLIALAVAGALAAPLSAQAVDVSSYGAVGWKMVAEKDHTWDFAARDFRLGFQAVDDTSVGKFIANLEFDLDTAVSGSIGVAQNQAVADIRKASVTLATQGAGAFVFAARTADPNFDQTVALIDIFGVSKGPGMYQQGSKVGNALAWASPSSGGLSGLVALVAVDSGVAPPAEDVDVDATEVNVVYSGGGLKVAAAFLSVDEDGAAGTVSGLGLVNSTSLGVSYKMGNLYFAGAYEDLDDTANTSTLGLAAALSAGANTFRLGHTTVSSDNVLTDGGAVTEVEAAHDFSKNTSGFVSYWTENEEAGDSNAFTLGVKVTW